MMKPRYLIKTTIRQRNFSCNFQDPANLLADINERIEHFDIEIEQDQEQIFQKVKQLVQTGEIQDLR